MAQLAVMIEAQEGLTWERWTRIIDATENLGFDSLWRSDHLFSTIAPEARDGLALWPSLTLVAVRTRRIQFGQLVSPVSFRHPVMLTHHAIALDHLSGGRYVLGIGAGWNEFEHNAFGYDLLPMKQRMDRLEEAIAVIEKLETGEQVSYQGTQFRLENAVMQPRPTRPEGLPMLIGGSGEQRTLRLVARHADEWNATLMPFDTYRHKTEVLARHCRDVGRDPATIRRSIMTSHLIGETPDELRERAARLQKILPSLAELPVDGVADRLRERGALVGTPEEVIERIRHWESLGVQRFMLQTLDVDDLAALDLFAKKVMPEVA